MKKEQLRKRIEQLEEQLQQVYIAGLNGIKYVSRANHAVRCNYALRELEKAMYGDEGLR